MAKGAQPQQPEATARIPFNNEAEKYLLGCVLLDSSTLSIVNDILVAEDFYSELNREIYKAMVQLRDANQSVDIATITAQVGQYKLFEDAGSTAYLMELESRLPSAANVRHYAELIRDESLKRRVIEIADKAKMMSMLPMDDVTGFITRLNKDVFDLTLRDAQRPYYTMKEVLTETVRQLEELHATESLVPGVSTGFIDLDNKIAGFRPGTLTILAARPAMGKTALALNFLTNAAIDNNKPAAFFSLEMTKEELGGRILSSRAQIKGDNIRRGNFSQEEWNKLLWAFESIHGASIFVDETPGLDITRLAAKARRLKEEQRISLIIIDYLQLMHGSVPNPNSREQEISEISRTLKGLAKELKIPIVALAQLNRGVESREDKRPMLSDLRESGAIEQDADTIMFIYRDDYYNKDSPEKGISEIIVAKQRSGATGTVKLKWWGEYTLFQNLARDVDQHY